MVQPKCEREQETELRGMEGSQSLEASRGCTRFREWAVEPKREAELSSRRRPRSSSAKMNKVSDGSPRRWNHGS